MRALLPLLSISLCLSLAATPAFADDHGHKAHKQRARSHDDAGARGQGNSGNHGQVNPDQAARDQAARDQAARARAAHDQAARNQHARDAAHTRARAEAARRADAQARARADAARREAARRRAAHHYVVRHRPAPPPARRVVVTNAPPPRRAKAPAIFADRSGQFSLGLIGGSLVSGYDSGSSFGDMGLGVDARYRVTPGFGLEASLSQHRGGGGDRVSTPLSLGVQAFAFSTSRVNPYAAAGVTFTGRSFDDTYCEGEEYIQFATDDTLFGPYGGLGLELAVADNATINVEGRLNTVMDMPEEDPTVPVSFQGRLGLNFYL